ncbi:DUF6506 family protein [Marinactinospora rubrisoli]|uniref:DUF6506 family protein n=1 Tax=Marinactinospora rubrisoli TaxID=2715399 RepID=A0ABW2KFU5_9ACTN
MHSGERTLLVRNPDGAAAARVAAEQARPGSGWSRCRAVSRRATGSGRRPARAAVRSPSTPPRGRPARQRVVHTHVGDRAAVVAARDASTAAEVAAEFVRQGGDLVEIRGGAPVVTAARVQEAIGGGCP